MDATLVEARAWFLVGLEVSVDERMAAVGFRRRRGQWTYVRRVAAGRQKVSGWVTMHRHLGPLAAGRFDVVYPRVTELARRIAGESWVFGEASAGDLILTGGVAGRQEWSFRNEAGAVEVASWFGDATLRQAIPVFDAVASLEGLGQFVIDHTAAGEPWITWVLAGAAALMLLDRRAEAARLVEDATVLLRAEAERLEQPAGDVTRWPDFRAFMVELGVPLSG